MHWMRLSAKENSRDRYTTKSDGAVNASAWGIVIEKYFESHTDLYIDGVPSVVYSPTTYVAVTQASFYPLSIFTSWDVTTHAAKAMMTSSEQSKTSALRPPRDSSSRCVRCESSSTTMWKFELRSVILICVVMTTAVFHTSEAIEWLWVKVHLIQLQTWLKISRVSFEFLNFIQDVQHEVRFTKIGSQAH